MSISFLVTIATLALVFSMGSMLLNVESSWGGMWDLGIAGQIAVGAYTYALLTGPPDSAVPGFDLPILAGMIGAAVVVGVVSTVIGWPALRLRGEYFLITTFAFAEILRQLIVIRKDVTGGTFGITSVKKPFAETFTFEAYPYVMLGLTLVLALVVWALCTRLGNSAYGLTLRAARDNEALAQSMGTSISAIRISTYAAVGAMCGFFVAPAYVWFLGALVPSIFVSSLTFTIWTGLVIGGLGSKAGPLLGALVLTIGSEMIRLVEVSPEHAQIISAFHPLLVGLLLIGVLRWRPGGLISERTSFTRSRARLASASATSETDRTPSAQTGSL